MGAYVDMAYVKLVGSMPPSDIDALEALYTGTFAGIAQAVSRMFDSRLSKRYATPFGDFPNCPEVVKWNVAQVVVAALWQKRGYNPGSAQDEIVQTNKADALAWLKEAADSKDGLVELPIRDDGPTTAVARAAPLAYSEQSPYAWMDSQRDGGRSEDCE